MLALRRTALCSKAGRRLCASATVAPNEEESPKPVLETTRPARLWAMQRLVRKKNGLRPAIKAWRLPACLETSKEFTAPGGCLLYLDRLQVHQLFWKLGQPDFVCTRFSMDIYDPSWERCYAEAKILASVDVYFERMNMNEENDIANLVLVNCKKSGTRSPIRYSGEQQCIGVEKGGMLKKHLTYLAFKRDIDLPVPKISLDVSNLDIGEQLRIQDLNLELELRWNLKQSTVICEVLPGSSKEVVAGSCEVVLPGSQQVQDVD